MAACKIDPEASSQFRILRDYWRKHGYPTIENDLAEAFDEIRKNHEACHGRVVPRFAEVLGGLLLLKYRQRNRGAREGARGGWRIYALFDRKNGILYPIVVYPKKEWQDASPQLVSDCVRELIDILRRPSLY